VPVSATGTRDILSRESAENETIRGREAVAEALERISRKLNVAVRAWQGFEKDISDLLNMLRRRSLSFRKIEKGVVGLTKTVLGQLAVRERSRAVNSARAG
jgi:hypothetical protein